MELSTQCPKCKKEYSTENPPKSLKNCQHVICLSCLKVEILCPYDRVKIQRRKYQIQSFQTHQATLTLMLNRQQSPRINHIKNTNQSKDKNVQKSTNKSMGKQKQNINNYVKSIPKPIQNSNKPKNTITEFHLTQKHQQTIQSPVKYSIKKQTNNSPQKSKSLYSTNQKQTKLAISPKKQRNSFQTCLLHSKKADLICMEDKILICSNCAIFGQHKHHQIIPYDKFLQQFYSLTMEGIKKFEQIETHSENINMDIISTRIDELLKQKRDKQAKYFKTNINNLIDCLKKWQRQLLVQLDTGLSLKKNKLKETLKINEILAKKDLYMENISKMSEGYDKILNEQQISDQLQYIDTNNPKSFIINEGQYLLVQIDNFVRMIQTKITEQINQLKYTFNSQANSIIKQVLSFQSVDSKDIAKTLQLNKKPVPIKTSITPPPRPKDAQVKMSPVKKQEEPLLLGTNSKSGSKSSNSKTISPIQPIQPISLQSLHTQNKLDHVQATSRYRAGGEKSFIKLMEVPSKRRSDEESTALSRSRKSKSRPKNERQNNVLAQRSDNKKKRKLELPEKYTKIYEELQKDMIEVCDFGGAFLGDNLILTISQLFPTRSKLKSIKLMNNKITDQAFFDILWNCRNVNSLNLSYNLLTQRCLEWLQQYAQKLGKLTNITLSNNKIVLRSVRDRLENLKGRGLNVSL